MALGGEVVDLIRVRLLDDPDEIGGVGEVAVVHEETDVRLVRVGIQMVDALGVERAGASLDPVDHVSLGQQELGQVCAVLAGDARDEGDLGSARVRRHRNEAAIESPVPRGESGQCWI